MDSGRKVWRHIPGDKKHKALVAFQDGRAELFCSSCRGKLWGTHSFDTAVRENESSSDVIKRLLTSWEECNGDSTDVRCQDCREEKQ